MQPLEFFTILTDSKTSLFTKLKHSVNAFHAQDGRYSTSGDLVPLCEYLKTFDDLVLLKLAYLIEEQIEGFGEPSDFFVTMRIKGVDYEKIGVIMMKV
jgi:hypothetical protein